VRDTEETETKHVGYTRNNAGELVEVVVVERPETASVKQYTLEENSSCAERTLNDVIYGIKQGDLSSIDVAVSTQHQELVKHLSLGVIAFNYQSNIEKALEQDKQAEANALYARFREIIREGNIDCEVSELNTVLRADIERIERSVDDFLVNGVLDLPTVRT